MMDYNEFFYNIYGQWPPGTKAINKGQTPISTGRDEPVAFTGSYVFGSRTASAPQSEKKSEGKMIAESNTEKSTWDLLSERITGSKPDDQRAKEASAKACFKELTEKVAEEREQQSNYLLNLAHRGMNGEADHEEQVFRRQEERPYRELLSSLLGGR